MKKLTALFLCLSIFTTHPAFSMEKREEFYNFRHAVKKTPNDEDIPSACRTFLGYLDPRAWTPRSKAIGVRLLTLGTGIVLSIYGLYDIFYGEEDSSGADICPAPQCIPEINFNNLTIHRARQIGTVATKIIPFHPSSLLQELGPV